MLRNIVATLAGIGLLWATASAADQTNTILRDLHPRHPRLFVLSQDLENLRQLVKQDALAQNWYRSMVAAAERILNEKPIEHKLIGPRLLDKSRTALYRISTLAGLYLIDGNRRFAERARLEMLTAVGFKDWNPSHFLDTAEMSNAVGIGYDWLYDFLSPEDRQTVRQGLLRLGLQVGLEAFQAARPAGWTRATHNWSQVCNGGLTVGALAIADEEPALAAELISRAAAAIRPAMAAFAPDGGFAEGPGYWGYATSYNVYYLAALETALKTDFGLKQMPGFSQTGHYRIHCVGPLGLTFNYADASDRPGSAPQMLWLSRSFRQPLYAAHELSRVGRNGSIFHLIWYSQLPPDYRQARFDPVLPLATLYKGVNVAFMRSAWNDPKAFFVGFKGGDNRANHSHLDLGSFVLDALGHRWAVDLGPDDYNLPQYFGAQRWTYYRLRTESHNTLTLDGQNQRPDGKAPIIAFSAGASRQHAVADLTGGYRPQASRVLRGLALIDGSKVLVQDELQCPQPVEVIWNFLTPAKVEIRERTAILTQATESLQLTILAPDQARFEVVSANPPPPQRQQPDIRNLTVRLAQKTDRTRIAVLIAPPGEAAAIAIEPLEQWAGPIRPDSQ